MVRKIKMDLKTGPYSIVSLYNIICQIFTPPKFSCVQYFTVKLPPQVNLIIP